MPVAYMKGRMPMKIRKLLAVPERTGFFFDDQVAIKNGAEPDGFTYRGRPALPGFSTVRQAGEAVGILLILENGAIAHGDCAAVQYSGVGGRDPLFLAEQFIPVINRLIRPRLEGRVLTGFRELAAEFDSLVDPETGRILHTAIRYGLTQALLDAVAQAEGRLMAEVVATEYHTRLARRPIPIFAQSGDERYTNVDKMIIKQVPVLPHGLINNVADKLGRDGELLLEYVNWLKNRVAELRPRPDYAPILHLDVYGTIGLAFGDDYRRILDYLGRLAEVAAPLKLRIEGPVDMGGQAAQIEMLARLRRGCDEKGIDVALVADEWCNTLEDVKLFATHQAGHMIQIKTPDLGGINNSIEAVLFCKSRQIGAYLGGTCNETDRSAQACVHVAMATEPDQILAKPGMGVDEGYMIVYNEMQRILALEGARFETHRYNSNTPIQRRES